jgi:hypothetical protein
MPGTYGMDNRPPCQLNTMSATPEDYVHRPAR